MASVIARVKCGGEGVVQEETDRRDGSTVRMCIIVTSAGRNSGVHCNAC
jgi:hypothetical protein